MELIFPGLCIGIDKTMIKENIQLTNKLKGKFYIAILYQVKVGISINENFLVLFDSKNIPEIVNHPPKMSWVYPEMSWVYAPYIPLQKTQKIFKSLTSP